MEQLVDFVKKYKKFTYIRRKHVRVHIKCHLSTLCDIKTEHDFGKKCLSMLPDDICSTKFHEFVSTVQNVDEINCFELEIRLKTNKLGVQFENDCEISYKLICDGCGVSDQKPYKA